MGILNLKPLVTQDDGHHQAPSTWQGTSVVVGVSSGSVRDIWIRFPAATIAQGSAINVAYITLTATAETGTNVASVIAGIDEDNHVAPTDDATWQTDHGIHTTATVQWDFVTVASGTLQTPSIVTIIQEIVDRAGWVSGNAIGIHIDDDGSAAANFQTFEDFGAAGTGEATLHIEYGPAQTLTGALFQRAPTFPLGVLTLGAAPAAPTPSGDSYRMGGNKAIRKPPRNVGR